MCGALALAGALVWVLLDRRRSSVVQDTVDAAGASARRVFDPLPRYAPSGAKFGSVVGGLK